MMKLKPLVMFMMLATAPLSFAATTMKDAVEQTVLKNPEVRAKWLSYKASSDEQDVARSNYYPRVDIQAFAGYERLDSAQPNNSGNSGFSHPGASIELRQMLFDGFATQTEVRRLGYGKLTRYYELLAASDQAALETINAYLDVLRYRELVGLAKDNYAVHKETYDQIAERVAAGVGRRVDLETATGRLALAESNWLTQASNLHDVSARYERLTGMPPDVEMGQPTDFGPMLPTNTAELKERLPANPAFKSAVYNIRAARADAENKKSDYYPQFEFRARQDVGNNRDGIDGTYNDSVVQLVMNYNLFRGGATTARASQYAQQLNIAYEMRDKTCRDIRQTTQIAWNDVSRLKEQLGYLDQHVLSTEKSRDAFRRQFDIGQRSLLDVLDTENELFEARNALVRGEYDFQLSRARVLAQTHQLLAALQLSPLENTGPDDNLGDNVTEDEKIACSGVMIESVKLDREAAMAARPPRAPLPVPEVKAETPAGTCDKAVTDLVANWSNAWSGKMMDTYLSFYSEKFEASGGRSRADWEAKRRARVSKEGGITLKLDNQTCKMNGKDRGEVTFTQVYTSKNYSDTVQKTLELQQESGKWKIIRERVTSGRTE
ncbi:TolC family outer membrane protein [Chitinibacter bivalviorum]|uniref:TolC family outer membrane protein n=1 Tax=Chitinibacter bivalviorum TaxID=2739434 RepID=A0A7H9BKQ7_9NEIS|nr:TolC family outer membrane protein [Chitinibacter bivalviorum]QLG89257.1 TolC family outer membrane protein [Chitinibacter bivalviorum]